MMNKDRNPRKNDKGSSVFEFGLVTLVFSAFLFVVIDSGRALYADYLAHDSAWVHIGLIFTLGFILGVASAFSWLRSELKFYQQFIEHRLSLMNWTQPPIHARGTR